MIQTKQLVVNPNYNSELPEKVGNQPMMWQWNPLNRSLQSGDMVEFLCNGRGRGGHVRVLAKRTDMKLWQRYMLWLCGFYAIVIVSITAVGVFSAGLPIASLVLELGKILAFPWTMSAIAGVVAIGLKDVE